MSALSSKASAHPRTAPARQASDLMTGDVATVSWTSTVGQAMASMRALGVRHLPILGDDGHFMGIVDDRLVALALLAAEDPEQAEQHPVTTAMTHFVPEVAATATVSHVAHLLGTSRCDAVVVVDGQGHLRGIITMVDVVAAIAVQDPDAPTTAARTSG